MHGPVQLSIAQQILKRHSTGRTLRGKARATTAAVTMVLMMRRRQPAFFPLLVFLLLLKVRPPNDAPGAKRVQTRDGKTRVFQRRRGETNRARRSTRFVVVVLVVY